MNIPITTLEDFVRFREELGVTPVHPGTGAALRLLAARKPHKVTSHRDWP